METNQDNLLTCLIRDDISSLILLYRKILSTDFTYVGINTAYDRKNQKFVLDQDLISSFPKFAYLGPTPIYEDYVSIANFPHWVDLNDYRNNVINVDIMDHIQNYHLDNIFPNQRTVYTHPINVRKEQFEGIVKDINKDDLNIAINVFDPKYDKEITLQYDITYILNKLESTFNRKIVIYIVGIIHEDHSNRLNGMMTEVLAPFGYEIINCAGHSLSEQMGVLLNCHLLISGPYGLGLLSYTAKIPSFIVYPFTMYNMKGHTVDPTRKNLLYLESTDEDMFKEIPAVIELVRSRLK
jgi:hypothetical protein